MRIANRKARFLYHIFEKLEVGLELLGTEIKSVRAGKVSLTDAYLIVKNNELILINAHIAAYSHGNINNHEPKRARRCLAKAKQIAKLRVETEQKGMTLVPLALYFKKQWLKCELGVARGKKLHDKRQTIKDREMKRDTDRRMRSSGRR